MPLSILKLEKLLSSKGFIPSRYFVMNSTVVYMEILSVKDAETFLLYIPSKYKFIVQKSNNVYKLKYVDIDESDNTADDYAGKPDDHEVENKYGDIDAGISPTLKGDNIADHLEESYKRDINLKDVSSTDSKQIKDICRQLKRFRFCVQNVKYKIAIMYKNFLCTIKRDDSIECYGIKRYNGTDSQKLYVTADLELLYEKMASLMVNMKTIRKELYHILDRNQFTHARTLQKLIDGKTTIKTFSNTASNKKIEYEKLIEDSYNMLETINKAEKSKIEYIYEINKKYQSSNNLSTDIERSHVVSSLEEELKEIQKIKENLVKTIFDLKTKRETTMLLVDRIMFDNSVMIDCVLRNFEKLDTLC